VDFFSGTVCDVVNSAKNDPAKKAAEKMPGKSTNRQICPQEIKNDYNTEVEGIDKS
jgi:hypothetical protein